MKKPETQTPADEIQREVEAMASRARAASHLLATLPTTAKNRALLGMAEAIKSNRSLIARENAIDIESAKKRGASKAHIDRLTLTDERIDAMADGIRIVTGLPDPTGSVDRMWTLPNGLQVARQRVPIGVIGIIYEARPNVTVDTAALCLKSGNAVLLRGSSEVIRSNSALTDILLGVAANESIPEGAIQLIRRPEREAVDAMLRCTKQVDLIIPRGGPELIGRVTRGSSIPVIQHYQGICHTFVDADADLAKAEAVCLNAKAQRPSVCNAMETMLVHESIAPKFLPAVAKRFATAEVEIRGCPRTLEILPEATPASEEDWSTEYLDRILSVRIVPDLEGAIEHIRRYGTGLSEAIVSENYSTVRRFLAEVDAAVVYANASTRFTDGFEFGFGAEVGVSTNKIHARGPMGLEDLTTIKYVVYGDGQIRE